MIIYFQVIRLENAPVKFIFHMDTIRYFLYTAGIRRTSVLAVLDFQIPCSRPKTSGYYLRCLLTKHEGHSLWPIDKNYDVHEDYKNSKIQEGEDVDVPRSPDTPWTFPDVMITFPPNCWCFWKEESFISRNWSDLTPLKCVSLTPGIQKQWFWWRNVENGDNVKIGDNRESSVSDIMMLMTKSYRRFVAWR